MTILGVAGYKVAMTRRRRKRRRRLTFRRSQSSAALRHNGMQAFKRGDFTRAIKTWERIKPPTSQPNKALAEAYFRRGLGYLYGRNPQPQTGLADLQKASTLQSDDPGYTYHLGLAAHHQGDLEEATLAYEIALQSSASGRNRFSARVAYPLALALLQQGKDPTTHPAWSNLSPNERTMLQQVNAFRRRPYKPSPDAPLLYRGLAAADAREQERACDVLNQVLEAPGSPTEKGLAHYYLGTLAARDENWDEAKKQWTAAYVSGLRTLHLQSNLTEIYQRLAEEHLQNDDGEGDSPGTLWPPLSKQPATNPATNASTG
ncbi:MAG: tetratricopeptide repeat protein [Anaerolineales bacterium]